MNHAIKAGRKRLKMTLQQFADAVGVTRGAVQQWEAAGGTAPSRKHYPVVAKLLGLNSMTGSVDGDIQPKMSGLALVGRLSKALDAGELSQKQIRLLDDLLSEFQSHGNGAN